MALSLLLDNSSITALRKSRLLLLFNFSKIANKNLSAPPADNYVESSRLRFSIVIRSSFNTANIILGFFNIVFVP